MVTSTMMTWTMVTLTIYFLFGISPRSKVCLQPTMMMLFSPSSIQIHSQHPPSTCTIHLYLLFTISPLPLPLPLPPTIMRLLSPSAADAGNINFDHLLQRHLSTMVLNFHQQCNDDANLLTIHHHCCMMTSVFAEGKGH